MFRTFRNLSDVCLCNANAARLKGDSMIASKLTCNEEGPHNLVQSRIGETTAVQKPETMVWPAMHCAAETEISCLPVVKARYTCG